MSFLMYVHANIGKTNKKRLDWEKTAGVEVERQQRRSSLSRVCVRRRNEGRGDVKLWKPQSVRVCARVGGSTVVQHGIVGLLRLYTRKLPNWWV